MLSVCNNILTLLDHFVFLYVCTEPSGPPTNVMLLASGPSTLTVSWSAPLINPEFVDEYFIKCATQNDPSNSQTISSLDFVRSAAFHNLIPDTMYDCEVSAGSLYGNSTPARASATTHPRESKHVHVHEIITPRDSQSRCIHVHLHVHKLETHLWYVVLIFYFILKMDL